MAINESVVASFDGVNISMSAYKSMAGKLFFPPAVGKLIITDKRIVFVSKMKYVEDHRASVLFWDFSMFKKEKGTQYVYVQLPIHKILPTNVLWKKGKESAPGVYVSSGGSIAMWLEIEGDFLDPPYYFGKKLKVGHEIIGGPFHIKDKKELDKIMATCTKKYGRPLMGFLVLTRDKILENKVSNIVQKLRETSTPDENVPLVLKLGMER
nr:hypothetical protein [Candidatus Sigynarchaeum springense]MDO8118310.1 hypothetical protein [Candidatus Sigynarchaeota archaeon]